MKKIFILSFDDGSVYDRRFTALLNQYHIPATLNLNSGLEDFVWYYEGRPVERLKLWENRHIFAGHEIASHSLTHPWLTSLPDEQLTWEIGQDCKNLRQIFGVNELGFAVPFTACGEREIGIIRNFVRYIRLSVFSDSFVLPKDPYHIPIHGLYNDPDIREKIRIFSESTLPVSLFVLAGHSYEFEMLRHWQYMEDLLRYIRGFDFEIMTTIDFVKQYYS